MAVSVEHDRYREDMHMTTFHELHARGRLLVLPNAWDAASARLVEDAGAEAIATTSSGVAWAQGYPDGNAMRPAVVVAAVAAIARVIRVPLTADVEAGYSAEPAAVGDLVARVIDAGAVGINLEDGADPPDLLCAKIEAAKRAADRARIDFFVNARTDVFLKGLVPRERAVEATIERANRYRSVGCDGIFVPGVVAAADVRALAEAVAPLPLNVMAMPGLPAPAELRALGARRLSAGAALASRALGLTRRLAAEFLRDGASDGFFADAAPYAGTNALFTR
jgi:2-methylisocitrate lyase-like PEP mutase family enzyme